VDKEAGPLPRCTMCTASQKRGDIRPLACRFDYKSIKVFRQMSGSIAALKGFDVRSAKRERFRRSASTERQLSQLRSDATSHFAYSERHTRKLRLDFVRCIPSHRDWRRQRFLPLVSGPPTRLFSVPREIAEFAGFVIEKLPARFTLVPRNPFKRPDCPKDWQHPRNSRTCWPQSGRTDLEPKCSNAGAQGRN